jgi:hypothetical protein
LLILEKIVDYKFLAERKARSYFNLFKNEKDLNTEYLNEENLEWAIFIVDSRTKYVDYEGFLIPMYDFAGFKESTRQPAKLSKAKFEENSNSTNIDAIDNFKAGEEVFVNLGFSNDNYLLYHGVNVEPNSHDCFSVTATFSERQDDMLRATRKQFFSKFFLFDKNEVDEM